MQRYKFLQKHFVDGRIKILYLRHYNFPFSTTIIEQNKIYIQTEKLVSKGDLLKNELNLPYFLPENLNEAIYKVF